MKIWPGNMNTCPDWIVESTCLLSLRDEYLRHSCRVCKLANECWPGVRAGSIHTKQSGQSAIRKEKKNV